MRRRHPARRARRAALPVVLSLAALLTPAAATPASAGTPLQDHWSRLGAERSVLGPPVTEERRTPDGLGRFRHYRYGSGYWTPRTGAHEVHGSVRDTWSRLGWERSPLGYPVTDERGTPDGVGRFNHFQHGSVYWTRGTGAQEVHGSIRDTWSRLGWERSPLGYPVTGERGTPDGVGRFNHFQHGSVYWTPQTGAREVRGAIRGAWAAAGWERSALGYPTSDEYAVPGGRAADFQGGRIVWDRASGATRVSGSAATGAAAPSPAGARTVLWESGDGPEARPYASQGHNGRHPLWFVEPGSDPVDRRGGTLRKVSREQFHRVFSTRRLGGPGTTLKISYRARATALRDRANSSIVEGVKVGLKFPTSGTRYSRDDPRSVMGQPSSSASPGSYQFLTGITERGYVEMSRNPYGSGPYRFFGSKRLGYTPGTWRDVVITVEWRGPDVRVRYWHNAAGAGQPVYEAVDRASPFARDAGFLWLRSDDADWEYDFLRVEELR